jgi:hypothetical protein
MHFSRGRSDERPGGDWVSQGLTQLCQLQSSLRKVGFDHFGIIFDFLKIIIFVIFILIFIQVFYSPGF